MSGSKPPGWEPDESDPVDPISHHADAGDDPADDGEPGGDHDVEGAAEPFDDSAELAAADQTDAYSRAYSAPESEHFTSGPYLPADLRLYDYEDYDESADEDERSTARWPWVVGIAAIVAAIALVVSVSLLFARTDTTKLANPNTTTAPSTPPMQDEITTTVTVTPSPAPPPPPAPAPAPPATSTAAAPPPPTTPAGPRQVTYSVTGTKAPGDIISVTYVDASGRRRTQHNVYIPWSMTVTPISQSDVGSVEASSLFRVSRLNCSITTSDGTVLSSNSNDSPQTSC
ncbi:putative transport accessory protein MmpS3 [Mycobacterium intracellulare]|uniref:MmpS family transport accessory protein n=1 Tax=Mycobacterium intracellulare TaxID=1767 RepID=UPI0019270FF1|nr:MmpS family transport accessory protein [Mycobacterium intracellulare]BCO78700.1 putative transport accessory protein MmpS3 [Mycobacterium intracellulare]